MKTLTGTLPRGTAAADDAADAALAGAGDTRAFERLYRRHAPRIHALARRMLGPDHAEEVTQDAFVRAWEKVSTFRGDAAFGTWLYRLAVNVILGRRGELARRRARLSEDERALHATPAARETPALRVAFEAALERLPDGAREVFVLHDVEGYKHEEIAGMLGVSAGTSKSQLHRARMLLRAHLD